MANRASPILSVVQLIRWVVCCQCIKIFAVQVQLLLTDSSSCKYLIILRNFAREQAPLLSGKECEIRTSYYV